MVGLSNLIILASVAASTVSAVEILFKRYSQPGCDAATQHIAKDTHLHDPHCKSFDTDEPAFYSFLIEPEDDTEDIYQKYCYAVVFDGTDCQGQAFTYGNMSDYLSKCADTFIPGRSVRITCESASTTWTGVMPATPTATWVTEHIDVINPKTSTPTTTITLVPASQNDEEYECDDKDHDCDRWWR